MKRIIAGIVLGLVACVGAGCTNDEITPVEAPITETTIGVTTEEVATEGTSQTTTLSTETSGSSTTITTTIETEDTTETIETTLLTEAIEFEINCETTESFSSESIEETTENFQQPPVINNIAQTAYACEINTTIATNVITEAATIETTTISIETTTETQTEEITEAVEVISKSIEDIAREVWEGKWGNGPERKQRLEQAGYDYNEVQSKVVELRSEYFIPVSEPIQANNNETYVKRFTRGTYYCYGCAKKGGSGRSLIECNTSNDIKGSIASSYLYNAYGYKYSGGRTKVRLEVSGYPSMNGYYYLDDSDAGNPNVIDFYYIYASNCPFRNQGVVQVECWIVN